MSEAKPTFRAIGAKQFAYDGAEWKDCSVEDRKYHIRKALELQIKYEVMAILMNAISRISGKISRSVVLGFSERNGLCQSSSAAASARNAARRYKAAAADQIKNAAGRIKFGEP